MKKIYYILFLLFFTALFFLWDYLNKFQDRFWLQLATSRK